MEATNVINTNELVSAIKSNNVSPEQFDQCKQAAAMAMQKLLAGQSLTEDEIAINAYISKTLLKVQAKAHADAEASKKLAEAEAIYKREMQEYKGKLKTFVYDLTKQLNEAAKAGQFPSLDELRTFVKEGLKAAPEQPADPTKAKAKVKSGTKREGGATSDDYANPKPVQNIAEGSVNWFIRDLLVNAKQGLNKKQLLEMLKEACPTKSQTTIQLTLKKGLNGRLPIVQTGDLLSWDAANDWTKEENVPMEVEDTTKK